MYLYHVLENGTNDFNKIFDNMEYRFCENSFSSDFYERRLVIQGIYSIRLF